MLLKYRYTILISRLWSGRHFPELSRHVVDSTLFHIALCANQFRVWNRYHIMTPVYVSVIYLISFFFFFFFCIRSLVRHLPNTSTGCFRLALFGKPRHWGQSECSSLIGWFLDMVYFQLWSRTESKTPHVTLLGRSYWISYIHTRSKKTKETKKLIYSIGNFLCNKIPCFCHHVESYQPSIFIISTKQNRSQFSWTVPSYSFCIKWNCGCDGTERGFT